MLLTQLERDGLLSCLQSVTGVVERRHTLPVLSNVLIERKGQETVFTATDLEIQISVKTEGKRTGQDFSITVAAKKLQDICRALPEGSQVSLDLDANKVTLKSGKSRFSLQTLPAEDFPRLAVEASQGREFSLPQKVLRQLLNQVQYAMASQDIRYYLNGLLLISEGKTLSAVATDGHRLAMASVEQGKKDAATETIIPRKTILELVKLLADTEDGVHIEQAQNQISFSFADKRLISKLIDGKFPDYRKVLPAANQNHLQTERQGLLQSLQRAAILSNEKCRGVRLVLTKDRLQIISSNAEQEEAQEEMEVSYTGEALDVGFNVTYLIDVLANMGTKMISCKFGDANSSCLITAPGNESFKYVVMPMRI
jgi:DNA polymerase-3 subunit beta